MRLTRTSLRKPPNLHTFAWKVTAFAPMVLACLTEVCLTSATVVVAESTDDGGRADVLSLDET